MTSKPVREAGRTRGRFEHGVPDDRRELSEDDYTGILQPRAISREQAALRGYFTSTGAAQLAALGFSDSQAKNADSGALVIPLWNSERVWGYQIRPRNPRIEKRRNGKPRSIKYELPAGTPVQVDIAPGSKPLEDPNAEIWITEGPLKASALICAGADIAIGLFGVYGYRHAAFQSFLDRVKWEGRTVHIAFDSDTGTNSDVARAAWRLGQAITARGGIVKWLVPPPAKDGSKQGVDDFFAAGGTLNELREMVHPHPALFDFKRRTGAEGKPLPLIISNAAVPFDERVREAAQALVENNNPVKLFWRGGKIVYLKGGPNARAKTEVVPENYGRYLLAESADWVNIGEKAGESSVKDAAPPKDVARAVLEYPDIDLPLLQNLVFGPVLRPDFTIAAEPGYDAATQTYYVDTGAGIPQVPDTPTQQDAERAALDLLDLIQDFGLDAPSRANSLAMFITPIVRTAFDGLVPGISISKANIGEGGGLLSDLASVIATGKELPRSSFAYGDNNAIRQHLTSTLQDGEQLAGFDNADGELSSSVFEALLTAPEWKERKFHTQSSLVLPNRVTWILNGINLVPTKGLVRRFMPITMRSGVEHPDRRDTKQFHYPDLLKHVRENRARYLRDIFTMAQAWHCAGKPEPKALPPFASFEQWRSTVGGILQFAGVQHFLENLYSWRDANDEEGAVVRAFFTAWWEGAKDAVLTTADIVKYIDTTDTTSAKWTFKLADLAPLMGDKPGDPVKRLPSLLKRLTGRVVAGLELTFDHNDKGMKLWQMTAPETPNLPKDLGISSTRTHAHTRAPAHGEPLKDSEVSGFGGDLNSNSSRNFLDGPAPLEGEGSLPAHQNGATPKAHNPLDDPEIRAMHEQLLKEAGAKKDGEE